jgi:integrase
VVKQTFENKLNNGNQRKLSERRHLVFTEKNVKSLPVRRRQYVVWDGGSGRGAGEVCRGLHILISPMGAKSYRSMFYFPGSAKAFTRTLGRVGEISLSAARDQCRKDRANAREGIDPRAGSPSKSDSYKSAVDDYIDRVQIGEKHNASAEAARQVLLADCADWLSRPIGTLRNTEIQALLERVRDGDTSLGLKPRPYLANLLYARMKPFFAWCAKPQIGKLKQSPMIGLDKPFQSEKRRERPWFKGAAADATIRAIWTAADTLGAVQGQYLKLLLLTGKRKSALAAMQWEQIEDTDGGLFWNAPPGAKNKRLHPIPLANLAARILHPPHSHGLVFPGNGSGHLNIIDGSLVKAVSKAGGAADFFLHGTRHIAETKMAELKIPQHIRDRLFDHAEDRGSGKAYDHHEYEGEMRAAVEKWAAHVEGLVQRQGVTVLR